MCTSPLVRFAPLGSENYQVKSLKDFYLTPNVKYKYKFTPIACGNCIECRGTRKQADAFRCMKEVESYDKNIMVTLTYNDEHLPLSDLAFIDTETGETKRHPTLKKEDLQNFKKRLRKYICPKGETPDEDKIKTFDCGEYGESEKRPHYHLIIMNFDPGDLKFWKWSVCEWNPSMRNKLYRSDILDKLWTDNKGNPIGYVEVNEVNYETCAYVAGYIEKKLNGILGKEEYADKGIIPPFTSRSKNLGRDYFEEHKDQFFKDSNFYVASQSGLKEIKPGRYFDKLMERDDPQRYEALKEQRAERAREMLDTILRNTTLSESEYREQRDRLNRKRFESNKRKF